MELCTQKSKKITPNNHKHQEPPGEMHSTAKQLKLKNPARSTLMCRLAAHACTPGGFWADSQNSVEASQFNRENHTIRFISLQDIMHELKT